MQRAYTIVHRSGPHLDVGPTFQTEAKAKKQIEESYGGFEIQEVACWIDDFDSARYGLFLFRTDGSHEVSYVVSKEPTERKESGMEALVGTRLGPWNDNE